MKTFGKLAIAFSLLTGLAVAPLFGTERPEGPKQKGDQSLEKTAQTKNAAILNINNFTTWQRADGQGQYGPPNVQGDGGVYPRGTRWVLFADGFVWGAKAFLNPQFTQPAPVQVTRVGGSTYNVGNQVGWIQGTGASAAAISSNDARARIYRIRRDYLSMSLEELRRDAAENNSVLPNAVSDADIAATTAQYEKDWDDWPVSLGAPYIERNGTPGYQKPPKFGPGFTVDSLIAGKYDEPGLAGSDPSSPASQVMWTVFNDLNRGNMIGFAGSEPMGLEMQLTLWGYKRNDALGNLYFKRFKIINKGGADVGGGAKGALYLDSMYVAQWSDPDLGAFGDDIAGCDSVLSMGFVYNGNATDAEFIKFNLPPPASGYDFLAGPAVPGAATDTAVFDLKKKPRFRNLPMTSFAFFSAGSGISDPPFSYEGALRWYRMLKGFVPDPSTSPERLFPHPPGVTLTKFPLSGDPFKQTGFLDGLGNSYSLPPGDRRIVLNTGPFKLAPNDTQEVVVGVVAGLGADRLSSVAIMKANDQAVQKTYDLLFQVSQPPAAPLVTATELDGKVIIEWGSNVARVKDTETRVSQPGSFTFEGYNVYQLPNAGAQLKDSKRIATYDVVNSVGVILETEFDLAAGAFLQKPIQFGTNSGVRRYFEFKRDFVRDIDKLFNGQEYYLAVTAYSRATEPGFVAALESSPIPVTVRPKRPFGLVTRSNAGDTVKVTRLAGSSDGFVVAQVISPTQLTGDTYEVRFNDADASWSLVNTTKSTTAFSGQKNQDGDAASPIADGMQVKVFGAPDDFKNFQVVANGGGKLDPPEGAAADFQDFPSLRPTSRQQLGGGRWMFHTGDNGTRGHYSAFLSRSLRGDNFSRLVPFDWEMRFTAVGSYAVRAFQDGKVVKVPFELWCIGVNTPDDPSDDYKLIPWIFDTDDNLKYGLDGSDHSASGGTNDPETDWIYWRRPKNFSPGTAGYDAYVAALDFSTTPPGEGTYPYDGAEVMARTVLFNWNGGDVTDPTFPANVNQVLPEEGTVFRLITTKPNRATDKFQINTASFAASKSTELEKFSVDRINVFPNPYYAFNPAETNRFVRFVTINNLPRKAKIRIFNLAGQLIRILDKDDDSQFLRWDLNNKDNFPVASGVYIAYLEVTLSDGSVVNKNLKIAVIQEQEVPDVF